MHMRVCSIAICKGDTNQRIQKALAVFRDCDSARRTSDTHFLPKFRHVSKMLPLYIG